MAAQGERVSGAIGMCCVLDPMAQDEMPEQEMLVVEEQEQSPPQMDPEPEMGAAAAEAAVYDTPPPHLRQIPSPTPSETGNGGAGLFSPSVVTQLMEMITQAMNGNAQRMEANLKANANEMKEETNGMKEQMKEMRGPTPSETGNGGAGLFSPSVVTQLMEMITQAMRGEARQMESNMDGNAQRMEANLKANANEMKEETKGMREEMKKMRGEMRQVGRCLQADKMAPPSAATNELKGSAPAGEDRVIRETCRVTEKVTDGNTGKSKWGDGDVHEGRRDVR